MGVIALISYLWAKVLKKLRGSAIRHSTIHPTSKVEAGSQVIQTTMDRHSFCGYDCSLHHVEVGSFCSIANGVVVGGGMHPVNWISTSPVFYEGRDSVKAKFSEHVRDATQKVTIGHDVWIGQNVLIKQGVEIGTGAVIGMGSIVTRDVAAYSIVAGNPAKLIRMRFEESIIERLLASEWWLLSDDELHAYGEFAKDPESFLKAISA